MSLVGTRPPTVDEWEQYELHHRSRMSTKPGITGMWQVSGRSDITDFEEVVRLDTECVIENCVFNETVMKEVDWSCTKTGNIDFDTVTCEKCCFDCINLKEHQIVESTFTECTIKDGNFENTFIEELHVQGGSFQKSNFMRAMLMNNKWENVNFTEADFDNATICEGDLRQLECAGVVLSNVTIRKKKG